MPRRPRVDDLMAGRFVIADLLSHAARILSEPLEAPEDEAAHAEAAVTRLLHGNEDVGGCDTSH